MLKAILGVTLLAVDAAGTFAGQGGPHGLIQELRRNQDLQSMVKTDLEIEERLKDTSRNTGLESIVHDLEDIAFQNITDKIQRFNSITVVGDSYASGDGALNNAGKGSCRKNEGSFGWRLNKLLKPVSFQFLACSGAPVKDILKNQVESTGYGNPDLVLMTAGGDNGGSFFHVLMSCIILPKEEKCDRAIQNAHKIADEMPDSLEPLYKAIKSRAPTNRKREVIHLGYVQMYNRDASKNQCPPHNLIKGIDVTWPSTGAGGYREKINQVILKINSKIRAAAEKHHITYLDVDGLFNGHRFCDGPEASWMQSHLNFVLEGGVICHPTFEGHGAYIKAILEYLMSRKA